MHRSPLKRYTALVNMYGAGDGNRTHNNSLEGCGFTTKLHPHFVEFLLTIIN